MPDGSGAARKPIVLVVNARYDDLDVERQIIASADVVPVSAATSEELIAHVVEHRPQAVIVGSKPLVDEAVSEALTGCQIVVRYGVGVDNLDIGALQRRGVTVANVRDYCTEEVATHALMLVLACARGLPRALGAARRGSWGIESLGPVREIRGLSLGIIGFGAIGKVLAEGAHRLGLTVRAFDPWVTETTFSEHETLGTTLADVLSGSDVVSINSPLTDDTRALIGAPELAMMRPSAYIVNTARAEIIDEAALLSALDEGQIAGAALDVLVTEPPGPDEPLLGHPAVLVTPHVAWFSDGAVDRLRRAAAEQVRDVLSGGEAKYALAARHPLSDPISTKKEP